MNKTFKPLIDFEVFETEGLSRNDELLRLGVPLAKGVANNASGLAIVCGQQPVPSVLLPLAYWPDGSIKWLSIQVLCSIPACAKRLYSVVACEGELMPGEADCGLVSQLGEGRFGLGLSDELDVSLGVVFRDVQGRRVPFSVTEQSVESNSFVQSAKIHGDLSVDGKSCLLVLELQKWQSTAAIHMDVTVHNPNPSVHPGGLWDLGDEAGIRFAELSLEVGTAGGVGGIASDYRQANTLCTGNSVCLHHESSGGENWSSINHLTADGTVSVRYRGYQMASDGEQLGEGDRAEPYGQLSCGQGSLVVAMQSFWQNFPKSLAIEPDKIRLSLFPADTKFPHELQGGERKRHHLKIGYVEAGDERNLAAQALAPLKWRLVSGQVAESGVLRHLVGVAESHDGFFEQLVFSAVNGAARVERRREIIDEYGWRNFGDCFADHEVREGDGGEVYVTHYNNQYDLVFSFLRRFLITGDKRWFDLGQELARHVMDIDIYHTDGDRAAYNRGLFWHTEHFKPAATATHRCFSEQHQGGSGYGGGPSLQHCYAGGLLLYYYLTGDQVARKVVEGLALNVKKSVLGDCGCVELAERSCRKVLKLIKGLRNKAAGLRPFELDGPGRGSGNALQVLLDSYVLSGEAEDLQVAERLIQMCVQPNDDQQQMQLLNAEFRWSYTIFLQALARYLEIKEANGQEDGNWQYAKEVLLNYARWMAEHEYPFLDKPELLDAPNFATRAAQDLRKSVVLYEASVYADEPDVDRFRSCAELFRKRTESDLSKLDTANSMRPLAVVMQNLEAIRWHQLRQPSRASAIEAEHDQASLQSVGVMQDWFKICVRALSTFDAKREWRYLVRRYKELR